ncbi:enolase-phosphatase E1-like [Camellia sinensis]|uniref:enolase-phosphatase E1-like n=1 Tax=Camellia sinensis TaxID=4442 RepID=UPI0010362734|nr:enolase-phosphatase E1-like [Camellia sinensis]
MGRKKAIADDLLTDIPDTVTVQPSPSQSQSKPKPKRLKKAQPKALVTQIDSEDTLPISKISKAEKSASAVEKRPAEAAPSESTRSKKLRSESVITSRSMKSDALWAPQNTIEDKPVRVGDSATDLEVGVALSTALLLPKDLERNAEEIQHTHSFAMQAFDIKKELVKKTKEAASLLRIAKATKQAQDEAEEKVGAAEAVAKVLEAKKKEAEAKTAEAQAELIATLATKEAEIKAADEKEYAEEAADVREDYKKQVKQACNKGFILGWMAALKELAVSEDSPLLENSRIVLLFPPTPSQSENEAESEEEAEADKFEKAEEEDEISKDASPEKTTSKVPIAEKSLDQTLQEIDVELEAEKVAEKSFQLSSGAETQSVVDAE